MGSQVTWALKTNLGPGDSSMLHEQELGKGKLPDVSC